MTKRTPWTETPEGLYARFQFENFSEAWAFMSRIALAAEKADHHPDWKNSWNTVEIWLRTHSTDKITDKDRKLAAEIDVIGNIIRY